jgi:hypothetical protein
VDRAVAGLPQLTTEEQRKFAAKPTYGEVVKLVDVAKARVGRIETSRDCFRPFRKGVGYRGYHKSLYIHDWSGSAPERDVANLLEDEEAITQWDDVEAGESVGSDFLRSIWLRRRGAAYADRDLTRHGLAVVPFVQLAWLSQTQPEPPSPAEGERGSRRRHASQHVPPACAHRMLFGPSERSVEGPHEQGGRRQP